MADLGLIGVSSLQNPLSMLYGGQISGLVLDEVGDPAAHRVIAIHSASAQRSGGAWSSAETGNYTFFTNIQHGKTPHIVIEQTPGATQPARNFDAVIPL